MKPVVACLREALAGGGVGGGYQVPPLGGTTVRGSAALGDDGGQLGESRGGGRFCALLPEAEGASACVCARTTPQREVGGGRRAGTRKGPAVRKGATIRDGDGLHLVSRDPCARLRARCEFELNSNSYVS